MIRKFVLPLTVLGISLGIAATFGHRRAALQASRASAQEAAGPPGKPYVANLPDLVARNTSYRKVVYTGPLSQIALMSIPAGTDIGEERHPKVEQLLFVVSGRGKLVSKGPSESASAGDPSRTLGPGDVVAVPPGVTHDIVNVGIEPLGLYTVYSPPNHLPGREQATKADAEVDHSDEAFGRRLE